MDFGGLLNQVTVTRLYSDSSLSAKLGMGAVFLEWDSWIYRQWNPQFIKKSKPSIEFLELYALVAAVLTWSDKLSNQRVAIYCDNQAVIHMVNNTASSCVQCMKLLRILVLDSIRANRRLFALYVNTRDNFLADSISRMNFSKFRRLAPATMKPVCESISPKLPLPEELWNLEFDYLK